MFYEKYFFFYNFYSIASDTVEIIGANHLAKISGSFGNFPGKSKEIKEILYIAIT